MNCQSASASAHDLMTACAPPTRPQPSNHAEGTIMHAGGHRSHSAEIGHGLSLHSSAISSAALASSHKAPVKTFTACNQRDRKLAGPETLLQEQSSGDQRGERVLTSFLSRPATARMSCREAPERAERSCASSAALCWRRPLSSAFRASACVVAAASSLLSCATCSQSPAPCRTTKP